MDQNSGWNGKDRRKHTRRELPCNIMVVPHGDKIIYSHTEDISEKGVRVIIDEKLAVGSRIYLEIYFDEEPIFCKAQVAWVEETDTPDGNKAYNTGIEIKSRENF
ncbi:MAG: PilZ domain-containing protein [Candidatus Omnitrophica bacterium]|nr:PilZ domain-containing protein [Candidatus Omnitrophota bacterium]